MWERYDASGGATDIAVFDPTTMALLKDISIPSNIALTDNIRAVAADQSGNVYLCGLHQPFVFKLDGNGVLLSQGQTGFVYMFSINIDEAGRIIIAEEDGHVIVTEPTLTNFSSFPAVNQTGFSSAWAMFVSFARTVPAPIQPGPSPAPTPVFTPTPAPTHNILVSSGSPSVISGSGPPATNTLWESTRLAGRRSRKAP